MSRSLDFTACTRNCVTQCFRRLSDEELAWLETEGVWQSYSDFPDCEDYKEIEE